MSSLASAYNFSALPWMSPSSLLKNELQPASSTARDNIVARASGRRNRSWIIGGGTRRRTRRAKMVSPSNAKDYMGGLSVPRATVPIGTADGLPDDSEVDS